MTHPGVTNGMGSHNIQTANTPHEYTVLEGLRVNSVTKAWAFRGTKLDLEFQKKKSRKFHSKRQWRRVGDFLGLASQNFGSEPVCFFNIEIN